MRYFYTLIFFLLSSIFLNAQIVINELDCDTPSVDLLEFIELKSDVPFFPLDGYVVVLFNGSTPGMDASYYTIDLDGYTTDINSVLLIGSINVSPIPQLIIPADVIQNGADAVAIYLGSDTDFPNMTVATQVNLIDALVYGTSDPVDNDLIALLGLSVQIDENMNSLGTTQSIQRDNLGGYFVATPTPRMPNDGSGVVLNGVRTSVLLTQYNEGDIFEITATADVNVTEPLVLNYTLTNGSFNAQDYTGNTTLTIPIGQKTVSSNITLIDDTLDEGDEVCKIRLGDLPSQYLILNNNIELRIVDNDFVVAPWGTPLNPTYGVVQSTQPVGYYNSLDGLTSTSLRQALQNIIANPAVVRAHTYADIVDILKQADQNPANSNQVWLVYLEIGRAKLDYQLTASSIGKWNREHTFPRSRAGYNSIQADDIADGINTYWTTNADSLRHGNSDAHGLRAADGPENSSRGDQHYGQYVGPTGTLGKFRGDVARAVLFLSVRYNGLEIVNGYPDILGQLGDLATILTWHRNDPPDDFEMNRNNIVYNWQKNRNPFIDQPELVEYIWGNKVGMAWDQSLGLNNSILTSVEIFPNPAKNNINIVGIENETIIEIFSTEGRLLQSKKTAINISFDLNLKTGIYLVKLTSNGHMIVKKIVVE